MKNLMLYFFIASFLFACKAEKKELPTIIPTALLSKEDIVSNLAILASDEFEGRRPFTEGEKKTVAFLEAEFKEIGLLPANKGSYFQDVALVEVTGKPSDELILQTKRKEISLKNGDDFVLHTQRANEHLDLKNNSIYFCGFGTVDPSRNWDDYADIDIKGKTALVLVNDPGFGGTDSTFFNGDNMTYSGRWTYKYEEADRQGAAALLLVHETSSAGYPWFVIKSSWAGTLLELDRAADADDCAIKGWLSLERTRELFKTSGFDFTEQVKAARKPGFKPFALNASVTASLDSKIKRDVTKNVIGWIKGKKYPDEYIVYTAHWDHLGIGAAIEGDSIYNGALDNASGTATILAIAKTFANLPEAPDRSVVFAMVTAEEQGLFGSQYYVDNPLFPLENTVCNINMDGVNPMGIMNDVTAIGLGSSDIDQILIEEAKRQGRYVLGDQHPEKGFNFRSDHFSFVKNGIPAIYAGGKTDHKEKGKEYAAKFNKDYNEKYYHMPSDSYDPEVWNHDGMLQDGQLYLNLGLRLANTREWPEWNKGSEFKRLPRS